MRLMPAALFFASAGVLACSGTVTSSGPGGTGGSTDTTSTGTTTTGTGTTSTTTSTMTLDCGTTECLNSSQCQPGYYCYYQTPCGDTTYCQQIPAACAAMPTCACLLAASEIPDQTQCVSEPMGGFHLIFEAGADECCP